MPDEIEDSAIECPERLRKSEVNDEAMVELACKDHLSSSVAILG